MTTPPFDWLTQRRAPVRAEGGQLWLAAAYPLAAALDGGPEIGPVPR